MSIADWSLAEIERAPLVTILAEVYGPDLAAQVICDVAAEIDALARGVVDLHPDGVWEEGYADALHDVLLRLTGESQAFDAGITTTTPQEPR